MKTPNLLALALALAALLLQPARAQAQAGLIGISPTGQPSTYGLAFEPYRITGFGRATFGMTVDEVRATIAADYPGARGPADETEPVAGTRVLTIVVPSLAPGPGPATLSFVFGATGKRLAAVNVHWIAAGEASPAQRDAMIAAGSSVVAGLVGSYWAPLATARGYVLAPGVVILFASKDQQGRGIEVRLDGVPLDVYRPTRTGATEAPLRVPAPRGSARLRLAVVADPDHPDILRLPAGSF